MAIVAGPQGSGKSSLFPVASTRYDHFNVDQRRKELNAGDSHNIPPAIREQSQRELKAFIEDHIRDGGSFAFEATLARDITFEQAALARASGFVVHLRFVCTDDVEENEVRIAARVESGGHGCSPRTLRQTYTTSLKNLPRALREFDRVRAWDTSLRWRPARLVLTAQKGVIVWLSPEVPAWLRQALHATEYESLLPAE